MSTTTQKSKAIRQIEPMIVINDPEARATRAQLHIIGRAVIDGQIDRFPTDEWKSLTKGNASRIIGELRPGDNDNIPASDAQKKKLSGLIHNGFLKGLKRDTYKNLTNSQAKKMIYKGLENEKADVTVEGYEPRETLPPNAPMTARQKERLTQLVTDGWLNRFGSQMFRSMTHEEASKFIGIGKARQAEGIKATSYVREPEAA